MTDANSLVSQLLAFVLSFGVSFAVMGVALRHVVQWTDKFGKPRGYGYAYATVAIGMGVGLVVSVAVAALAPQLAFLASAANTVFWIWLLTRRYDTEVIIAIGIAIFVNLIVYAFTLGTRALVL